MPSASAAGEGYLDLLVGREQGYAQFHRRRHAAPQREQGTDQRYRHPG